MMMAPLSSSHGRSGQRTPYLRQTSSVCGCRCPRRCRTCPASKYDAPGVLGHHQQLQLASLSGLLSLSVHAPPCPSLARARPQCTRTSCTRTRTRVFWPVGLLLGCCSCGNGWALEGVFAPNEKVPHDEFGVEMESVYGHCSPNQPS